MKQRLLISILTLTTFCMHVEAKESIPIPNNLIVGNQLIDRENGFSIVINPNYLWKLQKYENDDMTTYTGIDKQRDITYTVIIDSKYYPAPNQSDAQKFFNGYKNGLLQSGLIIKDSKLEPSNLPIKNSFRAVIRATLSNGAQYTIIKHFAANGRLYSISTAHPDRYDESEFEKFLLFFKLL